MNNDEESNPNVEPQIKVLKNGPYLVSGSIPLIATIIKCDDKGIPAEWVMKEKRQTPQKYILCRCGHTENKPFCDGNHTKVKFDGTETSTNQPYQQMAKTIDGPTLTLKDAEPLCASARFCHRGGDIWQVVLKSDEPWAKKNTIEDTFDCPSGRLVIVDKATGKVLEPTLEKTIGLIKDPNVGVDGPLWVRGGIPVFSAEGKLYEVRNRMTLCRCGKSQNKPFCDSSHYPEEYQEVTKDEPKPES